jgi:acetyltransferase-like isoleucine patch superfamily enzyme
LSFLEFCDIGNNVSIREFASIGCQGGLRIGNDVSLAYGAVVLTTEHDYRNAKFIRDVPTILKETIIEENVWVGARVVITAGITIGQGTVIGAGAVVTKSIPSNSVAVGVPAHVIDQLR